MAAHAKLSASSSKRWLNCPASVPLSEHIERTTSKFAAEGTAAHALGEYCLKLDFLDPNECIGFTAEQLGPDFGKYVVDKEMADFVKIYVDTVKMDHLIKFEGECEVNVETQVHLKHLETETSGPLFGTNDAQMDSPFDRLGVYDLKYGKGVEVFAIDNTQGLYYALGAWIEGGRTQDDIEIVIIQPRLEDYNKRVKRWEFTSEVLCEFEQTVTEGIEYVREATEIVKWAEKQFNCKYSELDDAEQLKYLGNLMKVTEEGCAFCPIKANCPKMFEDVMSKAVADFEPENPEINLTPVKELSNERLILILDNAKKIIDYVKSVQSYAFLEAQSGTGVVNHKLVRGKSNRVWSEPDEITAVKLKKLRPEFEDSIETFEVKVISPAQFEKLAGKKVADHLITKPPGKLTLVHESDKRQAVKPAIDDFKDLTDDGEDIDSSLFE